MRSYIGAHLLLLGLSQYAEAVAEPNPPVWPSSVQVLDSNMPDLQGRVNDVYSEMAYPQGKFSKRRVAMLFKPGFYDIDVPVGYYTQVLGLGSNPHDVTFTGHNGVHSPSQDSGDNFDTFWKGAENVANMPKSREMIWSVSQSAPLRRMFVDGNLLFGSYNASAPDTVSKGSGGYVSNLKVTGQIDFTLQQQWCIRNAEVNGTKHFGSPSRGASFVYVGTSGAPQQTKTCTNTDVNPASPTPQELVASVAPVSAEKPYITIQKDGKYNLATPKTKFATSGPQWHDEYIDSFDRVFVASPTTDISTINSKLAAGLHVVLAPGIYELDEPIRIGSARAPYQVLLGLGLVTLVPTQGNSAIEVEDVGGVRIAGILLQAGHVRSRALLLWGSSNWGDVSNPGLLADVFARVGGVSKPKSGNADELAVAADMMLEINSSNVVLDNIWLWRADCCEDGCGTCAQRNCSHGIVVNGHNVTAYGLAAEHTQSDVTIWNGEDGRVFFYQCEMDSFAHQPDDGTPDYGQNGISGYRVNAHRHLGVGVGVYAYFGESGVKVPAGIVLRHAETMHDMVCPYKWDLNPSWWPKKDSTIEKAIEVRDNMVVV